MYLFNASFSFADGRLLLDQPVCFWNSLLPTTAMHQNRAESEKAAKRSPEAELPSLSANTRSLFGSTRNAAAVARARAASAAPQHESQGLPLEASRAQPEPGDSETLPVAPPLPPPTRGLRREKTKPAFVMAAASGVGRLQGELHGKLERGASSTLLHEKRQGIKAKAGGMVQGVKNKAKTKLLETTLHKAGQELLQTLTLTTTSRPPEPHTTARALTTNRTPHDNPSPNNHLTTTRTPHVKRTTCKKTRPSLRAGDVSLG